MINLCTTGLENVHYVLGSIHEAMDIYNNRIKANLADPGLYSLFAQPIVMSGNRIIWQTSYSGTARSFKSLNPIEQGQAKALLTKAVNKIHDTVDKMQNPELSAFFRDCVEMPSSDYIYIVENNGHTDVVLTNWGFVSALPGDEKGWLSVFLEVKKVSTSFNVWYYIDGKEVKGQVAADVPLTFEVAGNTLAISSDPQGHITLSGYKEGTNGLVYEGDDKASAVQFSFYEGLVYDLWISPRSPMTFQVENQQGNVLPGMEFEFEHHNTKLRLVSDADGRMVLQGIKDGDRVDVYQSSGSADSYNNFHSYIYDSHQQIYKIVVNAPAAPPEPPEPPEPPVDEEWLTINVTDHKGRPKPGSRVTVKYLGKKEVQDVDADSKVRIKAPKGTEFEITALHRWFWR